MMMMMTMFWFGLGSLFLMTYQPSWGIQCQSHSCRTGVVLSKLSLRKYDVAYRHLTKLSIKDLWDRIFQLYKQNDYRGNKRCVGESRSRVLTDGGTNGMRRRYETHGHTVIRSRGKDFRRAANECPEEARAKWPPGRTKLRTSRQENKDLKQWIWKRGFKKNKQYSCLPLVCIRVVRILFSISISLGLAEVLTFSINKD